MPCRRPSVRQAVPCHAPVVPVFPLVRWQRGLVIFGPLHNLFSTRVRCWFDDTAIFNINAPRRSTAPLLHPKIGRSLRSTTVLPLVQRRYHFVVIAPLLHKFGVRVRFMLGHFSLHFLISFASQRSYRNIVLASHSAAITSGMPMNSISSCSTVALEGMSMIYARWKRPWPTKPISHHTPTKGQ